ncbi:MAG: YdcF family protein [Lachnospiraceae bacterium]
MIYRQIAFFLLAVFYGLYFWKLWRERIAKTARKTEITNKIQKYLILVACYGVVCVEMVSIILGNAVLGYTGRGILMKVFGVYLGITAIGILFFTILSDIPAWGKKKVRRNPFHGAVSKVSQNPVTVCFFLIYLALLLMYFNWMNLAFTVFAIMMRHIQVLCREACIAEASDADGGKVGDMPKRANAIVAEKVGDMPKHANAKGAGKVGDMPKRANAKGAGKVQRTGEVTAGKAHRYFGYGKWSYDKIKSVLLLIIGVFSVFYYFTCVFYAGFRLSFVWIWLLLAAFCMVRFFMLVSKVRRKEKGRYKSKRIHKVISVLYHIAVCLVTLLFLYVEANVVIAMNRAPQENLDYIIVLGAGLNGEEPTRPLSLRIQKACNYLVRNESTIVIASGGQGPDEIVSEAEVIRRNLVEMGIEETRIVVEDASTDTVENFRNSKVFITEGSSVGIVTNGFHLYRSELIASKLGYENITGVPAQTLFPVGIHYVVREFFGVVQLWYQINISGQL